MESGEESNEEIEHGEEEESQEIGDINEESQETGDITSNLKEEEKPQNGLTAILEENVDIAGLSQPDSKRQRSNAKAVECFDMNGNLVGTFRSGLAANQALNIQQGDISLCCRGLKDNINGLRFRFAGEEHRANAIVRRGYVTEVVPVNILAAPPGEEDIPGRLVTRLSRQNRIDAEKEKLQKTSILAPAEIKVSLYFCALKKKLHG